MGASGTATLDFGALPGSSDTSVAVTGQTGILAGSLVEAWIRPAATADHTADEHWVEEIELAAGNIIAGTGFTIYGKNTNKLGEPVVRRPDGIAGDSGGSLGVDAPVVQGGKIPNPTGQYTVGWVWN